MLDLSLRDLEYVVAVEAERNFSRAAERLHMAQPALSQAILRIERRIGVDLFERSSRRVVPTAAGVLLCVDAVEILERAERAVHRARQIGGLTSAVHVHISEPSLETPRRLLSAVRAQLPELAVHQTTLPQSQVVEELRRGSLGLAVGGRVSGEEIESELIRHEAVGVLMSEDHPVASQDEVRVTDLAEHPLVAIDDRLSAWNGWVEKLLAEQSLTPTWSSSSAFGAAAGRDLVRDGRTLLVCVQSIGTESTAPITWRPLSPERTVAWYLSRHVTTPAPVALAMAAMRDYVATMGWTAS